MGRFKKGFTLLELIIGLIILGVLLSLAIPRFFRLVERSRATEAIMNLSAIRQAVERCMLVRGPSDKPSGPYTDCVINQWEEFIDEKPGTSSDSHFSYRALAATWEGWTIAAFRNTLDLSIPDSGEQINCGLSLRFVSNVSSVALCMVDGKVKVVGFGLYKGMGQQ